jgi:hypothetical protein
MPAAGFEPAILESERPLGSQIKGYSTRKRVELRGYWINQSKEKCYWYEKEPG